MCKPTVRRVNPLFGSNEKQYTTMKLLLGELKTQEKRVNSDQLLLF